LVIRLSERKRVRKKAFGHFRAERKRKGGTPAHIHHNTGKREGG